MRILLGGSPCTHWSIAQSKNRETTPEGIGWELFKNYLIAKEKFQPDYFLYENNKSAAEEIKNQISEELGFPLMHINSSLVSAQNRQRFYVHNIPNVPQPEDRHIYLRDILETKIQTIVPVAGRMVGRRINEAGHRDDYNESIVRIQRFEVNEDPRKTNCLSTVTKDNMIAEPVCVAQRGRYTGIDGKTEQHFEPRSDGKTNTITTVTKDNLVAEPLRIGTYPNDDGTLKGGQGNRIYAIDGKSICLSANGGGRGAKTGLYAIPEQYEYYEYCGTITQPIYEVKNGRIKIRDTWYPMKLIDGHYIIRKLTVIECCRLQGMPDWWFNDANGTKIISETQCYRGLGNGWQKDTVQHVLQYLPTDRNEQIILLSMYDGIGTAMKILEDLGFNNVLYIAYEIDKYCIKLTSYRYPNVVHMGDAFDLRNDDWLDRIKAICLERNFDF